MRHVCIPFGVGFFSSPRGHGTTSYVASNKDRERNAHVRALSGAKVPTVAELQCAEGGRRAIERRNIAKRVPVGVSVTPFPKLQSCDESPQSGGLSPVCCGGENRSEYVLGTLVCCSKEECQELLDLFVADDQGRSDADNIGCGTVDDQAQLSSRSDECGRHIFS